MSSPRILSGRGSGPRGRSASGGPGPHSAGPVAGGVAGLPAATACHLGALVEEEPVHPADRPSGRAERPGAGGPPRGSDRLADRDGRMTADAGAPPPAGAGTRSDLMTTLVSTED